MQKNSSKNDFFIAYGETRTDFIDSPIKEKMDWFRFYFGRVYASYFENVLKDASILDIGCNRGYLLKVLSEHSFSNLHGVDLAKSDLKVAHSLVPEAFLYDQDMFDFLKKTEKKFDVIILKAVIEHIEKNKILDMLKLIKSRLTKNGFVLIDVYNASYIFAPYERYMDFTHEVGFTRESLGQTLRMVFNDVAVSPISSPIKFFGRREKLEYFFFRRIVKYIVGCIEPEMRQLPIFERSLIAKALSNDECSRIVSKDEK